VVTRPATIVVGIRTRTRNADETNPQTARIGALWGRFMQEHVEDRIAHRATPRVLAVYSDYESDHDGPYSLTIGCEVSRLEPLPEGLVSVAVPAGRYARLRSQKGSIPGIVIEAWQRVWSAGPETLGGERAFLADFEVYDERSRDPASAEVDLYLGLR
jgi:predicted transcriptional regulator YdeE